MAFMRHIEIETDNRKLLDSMTMIMHNHYKSPVQTAMANRKYRASIPTCCVLD